MYNNPPEREVQSTDWSSTSSSSSSSSSDTFYKSLGKRPRLLLLTINDMLKAIEMSHLILSQANLLLHAHGDLLVFYCGVLFLLVFRFDDSAVLAPDSLADVSS